MHLALRQSKRIRLLAAAACSSAQSLTTSLACVLPGKIEPPRSRKSFSEVAKIALLKDSACQICNAKSTASRPQAAGGRSGEEGSQISRSSLKPAAEILRQLGLQSRAVHSKPSSAAQEASTTGLRHGIPLEFPQQIAKRRYPQPQNAPAKPWTPTHLLKKRKTLTKRMGFMIEELERERVQLALKAKKVPQFRAGDVLEVKLAVPENRGRPSTFKGICIAKRNRGIRTSFTLRNHLGSVGAVERSFPLYSPTIQGINVIDRRKVRRAKLYYLRERNPKEYRIN